MGKLFPRLFSRETDIPRIALISSRVSYVCTRARYTVTTFHTFPSSLLFYIFLSFENCNVTRKECCERIILLNVQREREKTRSRYGRIFTKDARGRGGSCRKSRK